VGGGVSARAETLPRAPTASIAAVTGTMSHFLLFIVIASFPEGSEAKADDTA
jgi:hypothetical protein